MARYKIINEDTGVELGIYTCKENENPLDIMAVDSGYKSHKDACNQTGNSEKTLTAELIDAGGVCATNFNELTKGE